MEPSVSIIIPIYNVESFLPFCLDSLLSQTRQDFVAILIDDGSKDSSGKIAESYAKKDPEHFVFLHQENAGQGSARNLGLKKVNTPYVLFLDSDDFYGPRVLEKLLGKAESHNGDIDAVFFTFEIFDMASHSFRPFHDTKYLEEIFKDKEITNSFESPLMNRLEMSLCRSLWSTKLIKESGFAFPEGIKWEDVPARFFLLRKANRCASAGDVGAFYRIHSNGQTTSGHGKTRLDVIKAFSLVKQQCEMENWSTVERAYLLFWLETFSYWSIQVVDNQYLPELVNGLRPLFLGFSKEEIRLYEKIGEPLFRDKAFLFFIRSKRLYVKLFDRGVFKRFTKIYHKVRRLFGK